MTEQERKEYEDGLIQLKQLRQEIENRAKKQLLKL
jgi:hypothetical protein